MTPSADVCLLPCSSQPVACARHTGVVEISAVGLTFLLPASLSHSCPAPSLPPPLQMPVPAMHNALLYISPHLLYYHHLSLYCDPHVCVCPYFPPLPSLYITFVQIPLPPIFPPLPSVSSFPMVTNYLNSPSPSHSSTLSNNPHPFVPSPSPQLWPVMAAVGHAPFPTPA